MKQIHRLLQLVALIASCASTPAVYAAMIASNGVSQCAIVVPSGSIESEKFAAEELAAYLEKVTGARPEIREEPTESTNIHVGRSAYAVSLLTDCDLDALGSDGIVIRTVGTDLVITGGRPRGVRNAVYVFLEDALGCRWWTPDAELVPSQPTLALPDLNIKYVPPFNFRYVSSEGASTPPFGYRIRNNGAEAKFDPDGESILLHLLPGRDHFTAHPDWYMYCPDDGTAEEEYTFNFGLEKLKDEPETLAAAQQHRRLPYQPCMTSEGALVAAADAAITRLDSEYPNMTNPLKILWVVQQDGGWMCRCSNCNAIREAEGSDSANWLRFVNYIAVRVEAKYPDVLVGMHAYLHTLQPPKSVLPRDNILIYMAALDRDHKKTFAELPEGEYLKTWCSIAKQVWVWDYDTNIRNYIKPHPNHLDAARTITFCRDAGADGIRIQGAMGKLGDLVYMRNWVNAQMAWNPGKDPNALRSAFLNGYYGAAGPAFQRYVEALDEIIHRDDGVPLNRDADSTDAWLGVEDLIALTRILDEAATAVAADETLSARVRDARISVDVVWLDRYETLRAEAGEKSLEFLAPADPTAYIERLSEIQETVGHYREHNDFSEYVQLLRELHPAAPAPEPQTEPVAEPQTEPQPEPAAEPAAEQPAEVPAAS